MLAQELSPSSPMLVRAVIHWGTEPLLPTFLPFPPPSDDGRAGLWGQLHRSWCSLILSPPPSSNSEVSCTLRALVSSAVKWE